VGRKFPLQPVPTNNQCVFQNKGGGTVGENPIDNKKKEKNGRWTKGRGGKKKTWGGLSLDGPAARWVDNRENDKGDCHKKVPRKGP